jgi:hypothetical protein
MQSDHGGGGVEGGFEGDGGEKFGDGLGHAADYRAAAGPGEPLNTSCRA